MNNIKKTESVIKKIAPYSNDLEKRWISSLDLSEYSEETLEKFFNENVNKIVSWIASFTKIWEEQDLIRENFSKVLWNDFFEENKNEIQNIFEKKEIKEILEHISEIDNLEDRKIYANKILNILKENKNFFNLIKWYLENSDDYQKIFKDYEKILEEIAQNPDIEYNLLWNKEWKSENIGFFKKLKSYKLPVIWWFLVMIWILDINWWSLILSEKAEIPPKFFTNPISHWWDLLSWKEWLSWDLLPVHPVDSFMNIVDNVEKWFLSISDIWLISSLPIAELFLSLVLIKTIWEINARSRKFWAKTIWKIVLIISLLAWSIVWTAGLQAIWEWVAHAKKELSLDHLKYVLEWHWIEIKEEWWSNDVWWIISWVKKMIWLVPGMLEVKWWKVEEVNDLDFELNKIVEKLNNWEFDNKWALEKIDSYKKQIENIWDLNDIYKNIFENILIEVRWESASWIPWLWSESYFKIKVLLISAWVLKWNSFDEQLKWFIEKIYWNWKEWENIFKYLIKNKSLFLDFEKIDWKNINFETLSETQEKFIENEAKKIELFKNRLKEYVENIWEEWIESFKVDWINQIIRDFNNFIKNDLTENFNKYVNDINNKIKIIEEIYRQRDLKKSNETWNKNYKIAEIKWKKIDTTIQLDEIEEKFIWFDKIVSSYEKDIEKCLKNWTSSDSIESFVDVVKFSLVFNISYIILYLLAILYSIKLWRRESDWEILNNKEFLDKRDKKFDEYEKRIKKMFENLKKVAEKKWAEIGKNAKEFDEIKKIMLESDFLLEKAQKALSRLKK